MTVDELQSLTRRAEEFAIDMRRLVAEVDRLQQREVALTQRALTAEQHLEMQERQLRQTERERDQWRLRWTRAQESTGRWFMVALDRRCS